MIKRREKKEKGIVGMKNSLECGVCLFGFGLVRVSELKGLKFLCDFHHCCSCSLYCTVLLLYV
jgi:hypothetical protein